MADVQHALASLQGRLAPVTPELIGKCLSWLRVTTAAREGDRQDWALRTKAFIAALGHIPPDIWHTETVAYSKRERFFPSLAELAGPMEGRLGARRRAIARLEWLVRHMRGERPAMRKESDGLVRMRNMLATYERLGLADKANALRAELATQPTP